MGQNGLGLGGGLEGERGAATDETLIHQGGQKSSRTRSDVEDRGRLPAERARDHSHHDPVADEKPPVGAIEGREFAVVLGNHVVGARHADGVRLD